MGILIKNAKIITQGAERRIIDADMHISGNRIVKIGKNIREKAEVNIDAKGMLAFPGLVNTHTHVAMTLFRGYGEEMRLHDWLEKKIWPAEAKLKPDDVYWGTMLGMAEMIRCGTTSFNEMYLVGLEKIVEAVEKGGMRASIALGMFDRVERHKMEEELRETKKFISAFGSRSGRVKAAVACHAPYTCSSELIRKGKELANENKLQFHIHASETRKEVFDCLKETGKRPIEYLDSLGTLDENTVLAHATYVTKREIALVGKKGATVAHNPISNMKLASGGVSPISEFAAAGANVALGTDGAASNNSLDMIETMKIAALMQKNFYWDPTILNAQQALDFATRNGAKAMGTEAGSLEEGKLADIVLADLKSANMAPAHDCVANIVYSMNPSNIKYVICDGKLLMENGKITVFDEEKVVEKADKVTADIVGR